MLVSDLEMRSARGLVANRGRFVTVARRSLRRRLQPLTGMARRGTLTTVAWR
jgi:hypothetical protein